MKTHGGQIASAIVLDGLTEAQDTVESTKESYDLALDHRNRLIRIAAKNTPHVKIAGATGLSVDVIGRIVRRGQ